MVLPNIEMNLPQVYLCYPSWTLLPPPSPYHPSGSSQCTSPKHPVSCIEPGLATRSIYDIIHISMPFSQIIPPSPSSRVQKTVLYISVSFAVSYTGLLLPSLELRNLIKSSPARESLHLVLFQTNKMKVKKIFNLIESPSALNMVLEMNTPLVNYSLPFHEKRVGKNCTIKQRMLLSLILMGNESI